LKTLNLKFINRRKCFILPVQFLWIFSIETLKTVEKNEFIDRFVFKLVIKGSEICAEISSQTFLLKCHIVYIFLSIHEEKEQKYSYF